MKTFIFLYATYFFITFTAIYFHYMLFFAARYFRIPEYTLFKYAKFSVVRR